MSQDTHSPLALIVDDEAALRELAAITLERMGIACVCVPDLAGAYAALGSRNFDFCLTDMRLPDGSGLTLVADIQQQFPQLPVAMITAHGNMESAIEALKAGAFDFVNKPVDIQALRGLATQALKTARHKGRADPSRQLIGVSPAVQRLRDLIRKLARSQAPVYISGESGTGKELVARLIHEQGPRAAHPFVPVNCGALPPELVESELFGHRKGSFTGAVADKPGLFQAAEGGTLFLDEVGDLPLAMQVKLLRAVQERRVRPVGSPVEEPVDCRILSATHQPLQGLVAAGKFRQDLYYRINVIEVHVPALRERGEDLAPLVRHILEQSGAGAALALSAAAWQALSAYSFPGNVRELENILERALALAEGEVLEVGDLHLQAPAPSNSLPDAFDAADAATMRENPDAERSRLLDALTRTRWNRTRAAAQLGISLRALRYRLQKLGLDEG